MFPRGIGMWWAREDLNLGPLPCQGSALPLSYAPGPALKSYGIGPEASRRQTRTPARGNGPETGVR